MIPSQVSNELQQEKQGTFMEKAAKAQGKDLKEVPSTVSGYPKDFASGEKGATGPAGGRGVAYVEEGFDLEKLKKENEELKKTGQEKQFFEKSE